MNENPAAEAAIADDVDVAALFAMRAAVALTDQGGAGHKGTIISAPADRLVITLDNDSDSAEGFAVGAEVTLAAIANGETYEAACNVLEVEQLGSLRVVVSRPTVVRRRIEPGDRAVDHDAGRLRCIRREPERPRKLGHSSSDHAAAERVRRDGGVQAGDRYRLRRL